jgi:23S rRNA (adenine1618-N6)-methyltransferase
LHPRNLHRHRYDFAALIATFPALSPHVTPNDDAIFNRNPSQEA